MEDETKKSNEEMQAEEKESTEASAEESTEASAEESTENAAEESTENAAEEKPEAAVTEEKPEAAEEEEPELLCPQCGAKISSDQLFCTKCGAKIEKPKVKKAKKKKKKPPMDPVKKKAIIKKTVISLVSVIVVTVFIVLLFTVILPSVNLSKAGKAYEAADYAAAVGYYEKSGHQEEAENIVQYKYCVAMTQYDAADYETAALTFSETGGFGDSDAKIFDCGLKLIEAENYAGAVKTFGLSASEDAGSYKVYSEGLTAYYNGEYSTAVEKLNNVKDKIDDADKLLPEVYFYFGKEKFDKKEYEDAAGKFKKAGDYPEAEKYATASVMMQAEALIDKGYLNEADKLYRTLPVDFTFENISVEKRISQLDNAAEFKAICGVWIVSSNYIESRNVYIRDGSWESWYQDQPLFGQTLEVLCFLNDDGTVTVKGETSFYRFTNYSSLSAYCKSTLTSRTFSKTNLSELPSRINIDDNTSLNFSGGKCKVNYSKRDNYSAYFYNVYSSTVTFTRNTVY